MMKHRLKTANELWKYASIHGLNPLPKTSVSEWADTYRYLSQGVSAEPGKWRTERAEYQREIMNAFTEPGIHRVVVKSAAQIGKSDIMNNVIGRFAHLDPATIMMIQPTIEMAQDYSKSRIAPMIRDTPVLSQIFYNVKSKQDNQTEDLITDDACACLKSCCWRACYPCFASNNFRSCCNNA